MYIEDIDWINWNPEEKSTLMFIICNERILLIHKKRGLGTGKINGPGGKIELGERPIDCAIRETREEVCVTPKNIDLSGELFFQFTDGLSIHCIVYCSNDFDGEPKETDEAIPFWCNIDDIPFSQMWEDDVTWFDYLISKTFFKAYYIFDGDQMLDARIELEEQ